MASIDIPGRRALYVFHQGKRSRELAKFGEVVFESRKAHYTCIYVTEDRLSQLEMELAQLPWVQKVERGLVPELAEDFGQAFPEINASIKNELPGLE